MVELQTGKGRETI